MLCFLFLMPRIVPRLLLRPPLSTTSSSGGRKGKVKSERSLVVCGHLSPLCSSASFPILLHNLLVSLRALLFLHFQPIRCLSFRVLLSDLSGEGEGPCFSGEGGFLAFYVFKRRRLLLVHRGTAEATGESGQAGKREKC